MRFTAKAQKLEELGAPIELGLRDMFLQDLPQEFDNNMRSLMKSGKIYLLRSLLTLEERHCEPKTTSKRRILIL